MSLKASKINAMRRENLRIPHCSRFYVNTLQTHANGFYQRMRYFPSNCGSCWGGALRLSARSSHKRL